MSCEVAHPPSFWRRFRCDKRPEGPTKRPGGRVVGIPRLHDGTQSVKTHADEVRLFALFAGSTRTRLVSLAEKSPQDACAVVLCRPFPAL